MRTRSRRSVHGALLAAAACLAGCEPHAAPAVAASSAAASSSVPGAIVVPPAAPSASARTAAPAAKPTPQLPTSLHLPPDPDEPETYPHGVVSADMLESLSNARSEDVPPITNAASCVAMLRGGVTNVPGGCLWTMPSLVGFDARTARVAFLDIAPVDERDGCQTMSSVVVTLGSSEETITPLAVSNTEQCPKGSSASWGAVDELARLSSDGFVDAIPLVKKVGTVTFGAWGYEPVAVLRAPLRGFLLSVHMNGPNTEEVVDLVAPDNKTVHRLGAAKVHATTCIDWSEKGGCKKASTSLLPSVVSASLSPDQKHLAVLLKANAPAGHDTSAIFLRKVLDVPNGVLRN